MVFRPSEPFSKWRLRGSLVYIAEPTAEGMTYEHYFESLGPCAETYGANSDHSNLQEIAESNTQRFRLLRKFKPTGSLLDIGCGRGLFLKTARDAGYTARGIDVSERAVAYARREFHLDVDMCTPADLLASGNRFDAITLWHVLEHFFDPFKCLREVRSLLNDDGMCLLEVPNLHSLKFMTARNRWHGGNHPLYHRTFFTSTTLHNALESSGFRNPVRLRLTYHIPGRSRIYEGLKTALNSVAMDAFLAFAGSKKIVAT